MVFKGARSTVNLPVVASMAASCVLAMSAIICSAFEKNSVGVC